MTDTTAGGGGRAGGFPLPGLGDLGALLKRGDIALAVGVMAILVVLILPLPPMLLDMSLAISIILSVLILMTALFIHTPLEFSAFPTVLLIATMLRLALNLASTRLILARGHEGTAAAGHVIEAFGNFVMSGNFVIGIIVFTILVIVNFVVITKGSGRIAEVAARFHLDAMPGKQMAIDADLSAGLIDEAEARRRRKTLEDESGFFGAMDGASKFVRGDAIAGLLVVFINIIGGMIIGIAQQGLPFVEAARTYTVLTVGDGLVTQIPALIVSTAAGLLVAKAGVSGAADQALIRQLSGYPKALGMSAAAMTVMALLPGIPMLPFLLLGGGAGALAYLIDKRQKQQVVADARRVEAAKAPPAEEPISAVLRIDDLKIELGYALLPLVNSPDGSDRLTEQIKALRRSLAVEMGFVMPAVRILDNVQFEANTYVIKIKEVDAGSGRMFPGQYMVMDPMGAQVTLPGIHTSEPTFGLPATWVDAALKEEAAIKGYTVVDAATVLSTHLTELIKANVAELLSYAEVSKLIKELPKEQGELIKDMVPGQITVSGSAAIAAGRAGVDPRSSDHPGGHRRRDRVHAQSGDVGRARAGAARSPGLRPIHDARRPPAADRVDRQVGAGLRRIDHRPGRRPRAGDAALPADRVHHARPGALRGGGPGGRSAGAGYLGRHPAVRALRGGAVPGPDPGDVAGRDPPAGSAQDRGQRLKTVGSV
jgi:flagellar biosynthesis protein FlhA